MATNRTCGSRLCHLLLHRLAAEGSDETRRPRDRRPPSGPPAIRRERSRELHRRDQRFRCENAIDVPPTGYTARLNSDGLTAQGKSAMNVWRQLPGGFARRTDQLPSPESRCCAVTTRPVSCGEWDFETRTLSAALDEKQPETIVSADARAEVACALGASPRALASCRRPTRRCSARVEWPPPSVTRGCVTLRPALKSWRQVAPPVPTGQHRLEA